MKEMISKELLSEVLGVKIIDTVIHSNGLVTFITEDDSNCINIYELAHKCKEWAYNQSNREKGYCIKIINYGKYSTGGLIGFPESYIDEELQEYEIVFKLCQWILDNRE